MNKEIIKGPEYFKGICEKCGATDFIGHKFIKGKSYSMFIECEKCGECFEYDSEKHIWISRKGFEINKKEP